MTMSNLPEQRWALPQDAERDRYEYQFEGWINTHLDLETDTVFGVPYENAWEDEGLFSAFMDEVRYEEMP